MNLQRCMTFLTGSLLVMLLCLNSGFSIMKDGNNNTGKSHPGESLYKEYCSDCHGREMQVFIGWDWQYGKSKEAIRETIALGRGLGAMPAFEGGMSDQEITDLVEYLRAGLESLENTKPIKEVDLSRVYRGADFDYRLETVADEMEIPWGMAFLSDGSILATEKKGQLYLIDTKGQRKEIFQIPAVNSGGQGGLMDIALHPQYAENGWIYLSYSMSKKEAGRSGNTTAVSRFRLKSNVLVDEELLFEGLPYSQTRHHYGSRLVFSRDGYLYITMGERGARDINPQRLDLYPGKVHRLHDDGRIPADNPFVNKAGAVKSIWSYGHRNPQGMAVHPETGAIWVHEHGPRGGDELNLVQKGANYGWPLLSYGINYNGTSFTDKTEGEGFISPAHYWVPSIAPSGMCFITGDRYPGWKGQLLLGSLKFEYLALVKMQGSEVTSEERLMEDVGRVRDVRQGPDGFIYVSVERPGRIFRIVPVE